MSNDGRDPVTETLDTCAMYWLKVSRIPATEVLEMRQELELHLREADRGGKPPEEVVGPNVFDFAKKRGEPRERPRSFAKRALKTLAYGGTGVTVFLLVGHLWNRSANIPFDLRKQARRAVVTEIARVPIIVSLRNWAESEGVKPPAGMEKPLWEQVLRRAGFSAAAATVLLGANYLASGGKEPFGRWSWKSTLVIGAVSVPLLWLSRDPVDPAEIAIVTGNPKTSESEEESG